MLATTFFKENKKTKRDPTEYPYDERMNKYKAISETGGSVAQQIAALETFKTEEEGYTLGSSSQVLNIVNKKLHRLRLLAAPPAPVAPPPPVPAALAPRPVARSLHTEMESAYKLTGG